ncbi:uroporphyrinogen-III C-methyltransferase [Gracilibacillus sp. S3-1-1]|uniref:Uroporphyrinogen-III C-methyltransferase n=1 Tax=Gracilibacillus pellucidus TaxID=3095368 RepID=A0ACC6M8Z2_9BACI|nr:uroporphyrinogen-III C-methyltransferase [Gracilibacillus sp. S3-1-1]MDX8047414.1 uroporphyrinogen-III C-methyltransferase [Gracilibacillus sp. S3-1-1]
MGKVYLVGAGPGDAELITVKGMRAIEEADVILYDRLVNSTLLDYAKAGAQLIFCGKEPRKHGTIQESINEQLVQYAQEDKVVTRLKGGDPFIFGRGGEEALVLEENEITYEVVPGITSGISAAAYAGIPLTHRQVSGSVSFINGAYAEEKTDEQWRHIAGGADTLCFYMGIRKFPIIAEKLMKAGLSEETPVSIIHWGTLPKQKTIVANLGTIINRLHEVSNPSLIVIGEVVRLNERINWYKESTAAYL